MVPTVRIIRYQHRQNGLVHLASVYEATHHSDHYGGEVLHVSPVLSTMCGQSATGRGGWGHSGKACAACHAVAAKAEPLPR